MTYREFGTCKSHKGLHFSGQFMTMCEEWEVEECPECGSPTRGYLYYLYNDPPPAPGTVYSTENSHACENGWHKCFDTKSEVQKLRSQVLELTASRDTLLSTVRELLAHDGGPGSRDWDAAKHLVAREYLAGLTGELKEAKG